MASNDVNADKLIRTEPKRSHSWWWDSHISPRNSKWLLENLHEMDHHVKRMLKLIEEDGDSFTKKVEIYYQKRPELINLVEDVYRMYRALAERYDHVTGELRKNIPADLQSQCSGITDFGSETPSSMPSPGPSRRQSGHRAPGFEFFLGHNGGLGSDMYNKEGDETSTLESESESEDSSLNYNSSMLNNYEEQGLRQRIEMLEAELREAKEKLKMQEGDSECSSFKNITIDDSGKIEKEATEEVLDSECRILTLWEEHRLTREKLQESEQEVSRLQQKLKSKEFPVQNLQDQLKAAQNELSVWKSKIEEEKGEVAKLENRVARYKANLAEREEEIATLKEAISVADKNSSEENKKLQAEIAKLLKERSFLEDNLKELDLRCQHLENDMKQIEAGKDELETSFHFEIEQLKAEQLKAEIANKNESIKELEIKLHELKLNHDVLVDEKDVLNINIFELSKELSSKDDQIDQMSSHLQQLQVEHIDLMAGYEGERRKVEELRLKVEELEREVEKKQQIIIQGAEEKREAIRQLCFSLEHYRNGYHRLREVVSGNNVIC